MKWLNELIGDRHYRVLRGMSVVAFFVLIGKFAGAAKEMAIAWRYGISAEIDVYIFALVLVTWLPSIATSVLNSVLVPSINRLDQSNRQEFLAELTGAMALVALFMLFVLYVLVPLLVPTLAAGLSESSQNSLTDAVRFLVPAGVLRLFISLFASQLLAQERHANTLMEAVPALVLCFFILLWRGSFNYQPLLWGTLLGIALQCLALFYFLTRSALKPALKFGFTHPVWDGFFKALLVLSMGTFAMSFMTPIDQILASRLGDGSVATLSYANRLLALIVGLGGTAIARAILPVLSDKNLAIDQRAKLARQWSMVLLLLGLAAAALGWLVGPIVVSMMFERGAFTAEDTLRVSNVFQFAVMQLPFYFAGIVLVQFYASIGRYRLIAASSFLAISVKLLSGPYLVSVLGLTGLALSTVLVYFASFALFTVSVRNGKFVQ